MNKVKIEHLIEIIKSNEQLLKVFDALDESSLTEYYVGAGAIVQSRNQRENYRIFIKVRCLK